MGESVGPSQHEEDGGIIHAIVAHHCAHRHWAGPPHHLPLSVHRSFATCAPTHTHTHTCVLVPMCMFTSTYAYAHTNACTHVCAHTPTLMSAHTGVHACTNTCTHMCTHMYTLTCQVHMFTPSQFSQSREKRGSLLGSPSWPARRASVLALPSAGRQAEHTHACKAEQV